MDAQVNIGLLGLGNVGAAVAQILDEGADELQGKLGARPVATKILVRDLQKPRADVARGLLTTTPEDVLEDVSIKIVVELMGGSEPAFTYMKRALSAGKSVVTANKEVVAQHGRELMRLARENKVRFLFEASVGGGIPLIRPLQECLVANEMSMVMGILNGTTNYILSRMDDEGLEADDALAEAKRLGYAESDPKSDLAGDDAARKIAILASIASGGEIAAEDVKTQGIGEVCQRDVKYAKELGCKVKLIAYCQICSGQVEVSVCPMLLPKDHPLSSVSGPYNAVVAEGDAVGRVMFYDQGAGGMPSASAVVGDIADIIRHPSPLTFGPGNGRSVQVLDPKKIRSSFYLRLMAVDKPGVLSAIAGILGEKNISLSIVLQKTSVNGVAEIVMVTHEAEFGDMEEARTCLRSCEVVAGVPCLMRVWTT